jgi:hypothetical protein
MVECDVPIGVLTILCIHIILSSFRHQKPIKASGVFGSRYFRFDNFHKFRGESESRPSAEFLEDTPPDPWLNIAGPIERDLL